MTNFVPGLELSRRFFSEVVRPIFDTHFPDLRYAAARIGWGSDVLGFDTPMSMDHDWAPTVTIFLRDDDVAQAKAIRATFAKQLPDSFLDFPITKQSDSHDPRHHAVFLTTCRHFFEHHVGWYINQPLATSDWLTLSSQHLLEVTVGEVFHDDVGEIGRIRQQLAWYPDHIWCYLLAASWERIGQENHLMGRAGFVGDELGSSLIASRLVRDLMQLCFLMERRYAPYPKWFGSAFQQLACAGDLAPILWQVQRAETWQAREAALCDAYLVVANQHNALGITSPIEVKLSQFHERPFKLLDVEPYQSALLADLDSADLPTLEPQKIIGSIDHWSDSTSLRSNVDFRPKLKHLYS